MSDTIGYLHPQPADLDVGEDTGPRRSTRKPKRKNLFESPKKRVPPPRNAAAREFIDDEAAEASGSEDGENSEDGATPMERGEVISSDEGSDDGDGPESAEGFTISNDGETKRVVHSKAIGASGEVFLRVFTGPDGYIVLERLYNKKTVMTRVTITKEGVMELYQKIKLVVDAFNRIKRGEENLDDLRVDLDTSDRFSLLVGKKYKGVIHVRDFRKMKGAGHFKFEGEDAVKFIGIIQNEIVQILAYLSDVEMIEV